MKHAVYILLIAISVYATYKVTFLMSQEVMGALRIEGHVANHGVNTKILNALEAADYDRAKLLTSTIKENEKEIVRELVNALSNGKFTTFTKEKIEIGKDFLKNIESSK